jgi:membrane-associated phospholipid phosphatase
VTPKHNLHDSGIELTRSWRGALPAGGRDALRQTLLLLCCYVTYDVARIAVRGREAVAMANAQGITNAEKALHIYVEPFIQTTASHVHVLILFMDWFYANVHLPATILILVWIYLYRHETFAFFRNVFLTMNVLAMTIFAVFPVAPPRLVPTSGVVDTLYLYSTTNYRSGIMSFVTDQYAAFPSLHIGYALFLSLAIFLLTRNRLARVLAAVYPVVLCAAIIITGNHYVLDVVAGVLVLGVAFVVNYGIAPQTVPEAIAVYARDADDRRR